MFNFLNPFNIDSIIDRLSNCRVLPLTYLKFLCEKSQQVLMKEENVVQVEVPVKICGDIHGQFPDLIELLRIGGDVSKNKYVFLGDYVDRGHYSVETISYLLALKVKYPNNITLLRGNHQCGKLSRDYGLYDECKKKYGTIEAYNLLVNTFDYLPLAAVVSGKFLCMHGGLSPHFNCIQEINSQNRFKEVPSSGIMTDLLWSDPSEKDGFCENSARGTGHYFGPDITQKFIHTNNLMCINRAHEFSNKGYDIKHNNMVNVVFSAPNYCYSQKNMASFMKIGADLSRRFEQFYQISQHPMRKVIRCFC